MTENPTDIFVTIVTQKVAALVNFYSELLQKQPATYIANIYAEFQLPRLRLALFRPQKKHQQEFANAAGSGISLCVKVPQLELAIAQCGNLGCPPPGEIITADHGREIYAYDPDGNRLILHQSWEKDQPTTTK